MTEEEVRRLLDARTATIDPPPLPLAEISRLGQRRHRRQRILQVGGVAAVIAAIGIGGVGLQGSLNGDAPPAANQPSTQLPGQPPTMDQLFGTWRAVAIHGHAVTHAPRHLAPSLLLWFGSNVNLVQPDVMWHGTDLCNRTTGFASLVDDGSFILGQTDKTQIGCLAPPGHLRFAVVRAVLHTNWVRIVDGRLVLYASPGHELARFVRASSPRHHVPMSSGQPSRDRQGPKTLPTHSPPPS